MSHGVGVAKIAGEPDGKGEHVVLCPAHDDRNRPDFFEVQIVVAHLWDASFGRSRKGRQGLTDWSAYKALLRAAWHHGEPSEGGLMSPRAGTEDVCSGALGRREGGGRSL